jgi:hypothetical protein
MMITPERAGPGAAVQWSRVCKYPPLQTGYKRHKNNDPRSPTGPAAQPVTAIGLANLANGDDRGKAAISAHLLAIAPLPAIRCAVAPGPAEVHDEGMGRALPH